MKKLTYFIIALSFASCLTDEGPIGPSGNVNLNIHALYAGQPLVLDQPYPYGSGNTIKFDQFSFFVSNVALLEAETEDETDLLEVDLADFSGNTSPANVAPVTFGFSTVPAVEYRGIKINIGVPSSLNKSSAKSYGAGHPLKQAFDSHFWGDGGSFFFLKLAGVYDLNGDGVFGNAPEDAEFEHFPAKNSNFQTITLLRPFTLAEGQTLDLNLNLDVLKLMQGAGNQVIDLTDAANFSTYNPENDDLSSLLMDNLEEALEIQ